MENHIPKKRIIILAADHNGVALKQKLKEILNKEHFHCIDIGPFSNTSSVDYVDYAMQLGEIISNKDAALGILMCGTGVGMSIAVNKVNHIRAALVHNLLSAKKSREHNDANVLCLGSWVNSDADNFEIALIWLNEKFGEHRHVRRVEKLHQCSKDTVVFTNGIFDLLHKGHLNLLKFSKRLGGKLVVGINSDRATKLLKGEKRPINSENDRKAILEALSFVDEVIIFDDISSTNLVKTLVPNIVVKGREWTADEVRERDKIPNETIVKIFPYIQGYSSSNLITKIQKKQEEKVTC